MKRGKEISDFDNAESLNSYIPVAHCSASHSGTLLDRPHVKLGICSEI
jgi:hypothetical protein